MSKLTYRRIEEINVDYPRPRRLNPKKMEHLAQSIEELGLLHPITITPEGTLVAGLHRLMACESLEWEEIPVHVVELDELHLSLAEIDENLMRKELTRLEESEHLRRRKEIYETLYPETKKGKSQAAAMNRRLGHKVSDKMAPTFSEDAARETGKSRRTIERSVKIATEISDELKEQLHGTPLANHQSELLKLAGLEPEEQQAVVSLFVTGQVKTVRQALAKIRQQQRGEESPREPPERPPTQAPKEPSPQKKPPLQQEENPPTAPPTAPPTNPPAASLSSSPGPPQDKESHSKGPSPPTNNKAEPETSKTEEGDPREDHPGEEQTKTPSLLAKGPFAVIVLDFSRYLLTEKELSSRAGRGFDYLLEIWPRKPFLEEMAADDALLWLWSSNSHLPWAFRFVELTGFEYKTLLTWEKDRLGTGRWFREQTEHCLLCARGNPLFHSQETPTILHGKVRGPGRKPEEFYRLVEELCSGTRLELFVYEQRKGWASPGDGRSESA